MDFADGGSALSSLGDQQDEGLSGAGYIPKAENEITKVSITLR